MTKRIKLLVLRLRVKRLEAIYRRNPSLANLAKWSALSGTYYRARYTRTI